ncbi:IclR family transcriptional regulator [Demequina sp. SYSU T00068]|uniref:IclR family transcriptional regulator n=1 Tax=Demequina lignilytica TaxID=3051663 RepID=UPI00262716DD|nr:IclR family transcriptional regulator [Demequina sp. SYSU T00068]MDN4490307.1 IclR family transcriptional regulator [Demequina sp. SYSU T00068]
MDGFSASRPAPSPALDQGLRILAHLATQRGPVAASAIAGALDLPRSTVYRLLGVMAERGFVVHLAEQRLYGLGLVAYELSSGFARQQPLARLGAPVLGGLVDRAGESGHLAVLHGTDVVYIVEERAPRRPTLVTDVGVRLPALATATGRAILAALPDAQRRAVFPGRAAFEAVPEGSPRSPAELRELVRLTRERGFAEEDGSVTPGLASVAVAVRDHTGWPVAAIAVTFPSERDPASREALVGEVARAATELERRVGGARR